MSIIKSYLHTKMMDNLEMLSQREQLMEDIDSIVESYYFDKPLEVSCMIEITNDLHY